MHALRSDFNIQKITDFLVKNNDLADDGETYIWKDLQEMTSIEGRIASMKPLVSIFNAIINAVQKTCSSESCPAQTTSIITDGYTHPWSMSESSFTIDGLMVPQGTDIKASGSIPWYDLALAFTVSENARHRQESPENITHVMQFLLQIDPCRHHTYGIDIVGTKLTMWLGSRMGIKCGRSFDILTDYKDLIRTFLFIGFASKEDLGWDMSIKSELDNDIRQYDIEIDGEHYYTSEPDLISDDNTDTLSGSGTRIWLARKGSKDHGEEVVIKDYWPLNGQETEDTIQKMIIDDIGDSEKREYLRDHTFTLIAAESVRNGSHIPQDHTLCKNCSDTGRMDPSVKTKECPPLCGSKKSRCCHRKHHRIVYKEFATPFQMLRNTKDIYIVIVDILKTLLILHEAGWVHRDISVGNLYLYTDPVSKMKRGIVGDFEYAKRVGWGGQRDIRTGTPNFMAVEIARQSRLFGDTDESEAYEDLFSIEGVEAIARKNILNATKDGIIYNYIHDIESLWWIVIWVSLLYKASPSSTNEENQDRLDKQKEYHYKLFPGDLSVDERSNFLIDEEAFTKIIQFIPHEFLKQVLLIVCFREVMVYIYTNAEASTPSSEPIRFPDTDRLHDAILFQIPDFEFEEIEVTLILSKEEGNHDETRFKGSKRRADDDSQKTGSNSKKTRLG